MYCPVYGCNSDSQKNKDAKLHFFEFPKASKGPEEKKRRDVWINFCKRKNFIPSRSTRICSLHFNSDAYIHSNSPEFLSSIGFTDTRRVKLKNNAVPTENKPLQDTENEGRTTAKRSAGSLSRRRVGQEFYYTLYRPLNFSCDQYFAHGSNTVPQKFLPKISGLNDRHQ